MSGTSANHTTKCLTLEDRDPTQSIVVPPDMPGVVDEALGVCRILAELHEVGIHRGMNLMTESGMIDLQWSETGGIGHCSEEKEATEMVEKTSLLDFV